MLALHAVSPKLVDVSQMGKADEALALERLLAEHSVADAVQSVFKCREPDFAEQIADDICSRMDSTEVCCFHQQHVNSGIRFQ